MASEYKPNLGVIPITAATVTLNVDGYAGRTVVLERAAGVTVTLPPATGSGYTFSVAVGTTVTSNSHIVRVTGTDVMAGIVTLSTDIAGVALRTSADTDTITMGGSTTGGIIGTMLHFQDIKSGIWQLSGDIVTTGAEATPFSAAVT